MTLVAIVVYGQESSQNLCRLLNGLQIKFKLILPNEIPLWGSSGGPSHIILTGGPAHVYDPLAPSIPSWVLQSKAPVLGICYGMELIAQTFGGIVAKMEKAETGLVEVTEIIDGVQSTLSRWMNRMDQVLAAPPTFVVTGVTSEGHIAAITDQARCWGVQYHPESPCDPNKEVLKRFLTLKIAA